MTSGFSFVSVWRPLFTYLAGSQPERTFAVPPVPTIIDGDVMVRSLWFIELEPVFRTFIAIYLHHFGAGTSHACGMPSTSVLGAIWNEDCFLFLLSCLFVFWTVHALGNNTEYTNHHHQHHQQQQQHQAEEEEEEEDKKEQWKKRKDKPKKSIE